MAWDDVVVAHVTKYLAANYNAMVTYIKGHKTQHENGGVDEISVAGLSGQLADGQTPLSHKTSHQDGGTDELNVTGLAGQLADGQPTISHKTNHQNGGTDEISVAGLSGQLADGQTPLAHAASHTSGSTDVITILMTQVTGLVAALLGKEPVITPKNTAFNKDYGTNAADVKMNGTAGVGSTDAVARIDHIHPQDTSRIQAHANVTAINGAGISDGEIALFNLTNKDIRTSDKTIVTTMGSDDATVPTSKAVVDSMISKETNVTAINDTGIADGEIAVFNLSAKDIRTSDKTIVTTLGADDTSVPTSKAVKTVTDLLAPIASPTLTGVPAAPTAADGTSTTQIATTEYVEDAILDRATRSVAVVDIYVDSAAAGSGTGVDWTNAFTTLTAALASLPTIIETAITIYVRKGASAYVEAPIVSQIVGKGSLKIQGEYYWNGQCAAASTPSTTKFNLTSTSGANIAIGDQIMVTSGSGGSGAYKYFTRTTVKGVVDKGSNVWEVELTSALDSGNIGTTEYYTIAKTQITGVWFVKNSSVVSIYGLYLNSVARTISVDTVGALYIAYSFIETTTNFAWFVESGGLITSEACYIGATTGTAAYTSIGGTIRAGYSASTVSVYSSKYPLGAAYGSLVYVSQAIVHINANFGIGVQAQKGAYFFLAVATIVITSGVTSTTGFQNVEGATVGIGTVTNTQTAVPMAGDLPKAYTPTLAWMTGTPATITTIARTWRYLTTVWFVVDISSANGNGATALTITLPTTPTNNGNNIPCSALQLNNTTWSDPLAYILADGSNNKINFRAFTPVAAGNAIKIQVSGFYEMSILP